MSRGAKVQLTIDANSKQAEDNLRRLQAEAAKTGESVSRLDQAASARHLERFEGRLQKNAEAARYFGGETAALEKEQQMLRREIERLIRQGMDPLDSTVTRLRSRYDNNASALTRLTAAKGKYTAVTRAATTAATAFMRTVLPFVGATAAIGAATRFITGSGDAFQQAEAEAQKFAITYAGITEEAEQRARSLADTFGYAGSTMRGILAETGDILTGFGLAGEAALDLTERAAYLGAALSKMNPNIGDAAAATQDLTKLMAGQAMSMQKWGVVVRDSAVQARLMEQGLSGLTGEALLQAQAQARLEIAYEQSRNALANVTSETLLAVDVNRRYNEAMKERREIVGEAITNFFTPIKLRITEQIEAWNEATIAKQNYDAALTGGAEDVGLSGLEKAAQYAEGELERLKGSLGELEAARERNLAAGSPYLNRALSTIESNIAALQADIILKEAELDSIQSQIAREQTRQEQEASRRQPAAETGGRTSQMVQAFRESAAELSKLSQEMDQQLESVDRAAEAYAEAGIEFDAFSNKQATARKMLTELLSNEVLNEQHLNEFIATYREFLADVEIIEPEVKGPSLDDFTASLEKQLTSIDRVSTAYGQAGGELESFERKQSAVLRTFEQLAAAGADAAYLDEFIAKYQEFLDLSTPEGPADPTSAEIYEGIRKEIDQQISTIENLAAAHEAAGIEYDAFSQKQAAARSTLISMVTAGQLAEVQIRDYIEAYREYLADVEEASPEIPGPDFEAMTAELRDQVDGIEKLRAAYELAGGEFDDFSQQQRAVKRSFEELVAAGADAAFLSEFTAEFGRFLEAAERTESIAEVLSQVDEQAFNLQRSYAEMGRELGETEAKTMVLEQELQRLADTGQYTAWELYQIEKALQSLQGEAEGTSEAWKRLTDTMAASMGAFLEDTIGSLGSGEFDLARSLQGSIDRVVGGAADAAKAAFPQFAPLIDMGEGAVKGLNRAIFGTITASRDAQAVIDTQQTAVRDLFMDVLGLEEDLSRQRLDAIREQMDLLSDQHDLEMQILRDRWQRGEISGEQYFSHAMAASTEHRETQTSFERQQSLLEGVRGTIDELQDELDGLSGWTKFWTSADTKLEKEIAAYEQLLAAVSAAEGLSESEIKDLARTYGIDVPGAARGADFTTTGPMLMAVGDNPGGKERVQITPISSYHAYGPSPGGSSGGEIHIHITGDVYGVDDLYSRLDTAGKRLKKLGRLPA